MKKICKHCLQEVDERYRRNQFGDVFCDDDCYDNYYEINDIECDDCSHPYIDDYEGIRSNYLDWLENWENDLNKLSHHENLQYEVFKMLDTIDEVYDAYWDYYKTEGDDGVFAREIYLYLLKFEELQKEIVQWRPEQHLRYLD